MIHPRFYLFIIALLTLVSVPASADSKVLSLEKLTSDYVPVAELLISELHGINQFKEIRTLDELGLAQFQSMASRMNNFVGYRESTWYRLDVSYQPDAASSLNPNSDRVTTDDTAREGHFKIISFSTLMEQFDVYVDKNGVIEEVQSGYSRAIEDKFTATHFNAKFALKAGEHASIYIRTLTPFVYQSVPFLITEESVNRHVSLIHTHILSATYGMLALLVFSNLFMLFKLRSLAHLYYVVFISLSVLFVSIFDGTGYRLVWKSYPGFNDWALPFVLITSTATYLLFSARYLEFKVQCRNLYRIANSLALSNLIFAAVMPFLSLSVTLLNVLFVFSPLNVLVLLLMFKISIGNKHPIAIYYSVATIAGLSGVAIKFMSQLGLVEVTVLTYHAATLGFLVQNLIFAYCVAAGVLSIQHQRDKLAELNEVSRNDALEAIKESNRLKNRFLELISHELRTPMNGVQGSIELLAMTPLTQEGKTYLDTAQQSSSEMMLLVDAILSFAEIQTGVIKVKKRLFSLSTVLKPVCKKTSQQCQAKNISFMLDFDHSSTDYFWGDDRKIANIVAILLDNALRSTHVGGVKLSVSVTRSLAQENEFEVFFAISDTGAGMPASEYDRLFNTYSMTGNEHHFVEDTAGGGIGLPLSKELIQLLGGELTVYSMPESGSELSFTLKLTSATESEQNVYLGQAQQSGDVDRRNATDHLAGKTILVAEDNNINLMVLSAILKKFQCRVLTAVNGYDVLKLAFSHHVDAILMDCQMPEMDGFEATRQIRESDHAIKDVPIIAVTANAIEGNSERCIISGMNDYLKKPIKSSDVVEKLVYWLSIKTE